jgi:hypothetical protein
MYSRNKACSGCGYAYTPIKYGCPVCGTKISGEVLNINIQVLSTSVETKPTTKGSYQVVEVAYKDITNGGKVSAKKIMSFTNKEVFEVMSLAKPTEYYDVTMEKGEKYWEWVKAIKGSVSATTSTNSTAASSARTTGTTTNSRGFETPEERAARQVYIVRQSSLSTAAEILSVGAKTAPKANDVINLAKEFEAYVFGTGTANAQAVAAKDVGTIETLSEDIPF